LAVRGVESAMYETVEINHRSSTQVANPNLDIHFHDGVGWNERWILPVPYAGASVMRMMLRSPIFMPRMVAFFSTPQSSCRQSPFSVY
jgi:hypothetical protein